MMQHACVQLLRVLALVLGACMATLAEEQTQPAALTADEPYSEGGSKPTLPLPDPWVSCLGEEREREQCNVGDDNRGWGNLGSNNRGDFNFGNNSRGDCNVADDSFGIGGPDHQGCPKETWPHIVRFCSLFPYYHKCSSPPVYYGDDLAEELAAAILRCDGSIAIPPRPKAAVNKARQKKRSAYLQRVKVQRGAL